MDINQTSQNVMYDMNITSITNLLNTTLRSSSNITYDSCAHWREPQHVLFQFACVTFALGFIIPHTYSNHVLISRGSLVLGALLVVLWGAVIVCHQDILIWYIIICSVNFIHCIIWLYLSRPANLPRCLEDAYNKLFKPLQISRVEFKKFADICKIRDLPDGAVFAMEGATETGDRLSILLSGRLKVTCDGLFLHTVEPSQFVDSVEFDGMSEVTEDGSQSCFQVTIRAVEDCKLCVCDTDMIKDFLKQNLYFSSVLSNLLGKDITHKLYQVQEMLLSHPQYTRLLGKKNSAVHLRNTIHQGYPEKSGSINGNGALRTHSPLGSRASGNSHRSSNVIRHHVTFVEPGKVHYKCPRVRYH